MLFVDILLSRSAHDAKMSEQALTKWEVPTDIFTFVFFVGNFAVVGVIAVFYQKGVPTLVTQAYLVRSGITM